LLCNGPFYLSYWTREASLTLKANEVYKGNAEVKPASVTLFVNNDDDLRLAKLVEGSYCAAPLGTVVADESQGLIVTKSYDTVWSLCFNCSDSALSNTELRRALCGSVNTQNITMDSGDLQKTHSVIPLSCTVPQADMSSVPVTILGYDTQKAATRWSNALNALGRTTVNLEIICIPEHETAMRYMIQEWQKNFGLSINISISAVERVDLDERIQAGDYQIALAPVKADSSSAAGFLSSITSGGHNNIFNFRNDSFDSAVDRLQLQSGNELLKACRDAEAKFLVSAVALPLFCSPSYFAVSEDVEGSYVNPENSTVSFSAVTRKD
jgi:ABC-type oligopeptide transport system substrate-binding subunit